MQDFFETDIYNYILTPIIYIALAYIAYKLITNIINHALRAKSSLNKNKKRIDTIRSIIKNIIKYIIIIVTLLLILGLYHVDVNKIFAGLGIGVAIFSLAFQDIAKDFLAGMAILLDDQFDIGDNVSINGFRGDVVAIGLRTVRIKDYKGAVLIIANHSITEVINYSLNPSLAIIDLPVSYDSDLNKVEKVINDTIEVINKTYDHLKGKVELWGIQEMAYSALMYRVVVKTTSNKDFEIERKMKKEFTLAFEKAKIKIPYPQVEVHHE